MFIKVIFDLPAGNLGVAALVKNNLRLLSEKHYREICQTLPRILNFELRHTELL